MKSPLLTAFVVISLPVNVLGVVTVDADDPLIQYTGRTNHADPKAPIMWWPGSDVIANFEGAAINVKLHDYGDNYFYVIIDDGTPSLINLTPEGSESSILFCFLVNKNPRSSAKSAVALPSPLRPCSELAPFGFAQGRL